MERITTEWRFQETHKRQLTRENLDMAERETKSLLVAAQNNAMGTNYVNARIEEMQQNRRRRLCGDRDDQSHKRIQ